MKNMMLVIASVFIALLSVIASPGSIAVGENILNNPEFSATDDGLPLSWNYNFAGNNGRMKIVGDGEMREAVFFPGEGVCQLEQRDIHLVPGAKYKLGGWVKTKNLKAPMYGNFGDGPQNP